MLIGLAPGRRRLQRLRLAVEQRCRQPILEILDAARDARLRQVEPSRGADDRAGFHHGDEGFEVMDVHAHLA